MRHVPRNVACSTRNRRSALKRRPQVLHAVDRSHGDFAHHLVAPYLQRDGASRRAARPQCMIKLSLAADRLAANCEYHITAPDAAVLGGGITQHLGYDDMLADFL